MPEGKSLQFKKQYGNPGDLLVPAHSTNGSDAELVTLSSRPLDSSGFGGLAATVKAALDGHAEREGNKPQRVISIGWNEQVERGGLAQTLPPLHNGDSFDAVYMPLTEQEREKYLDGFANRVLWFLCHGLTERCKVDPDALTMFEEKNRDAARVAAHYSKDKVFWAHDFQMWLVPEFVRELNPEQLIGYFHHIPFPDPQTFSWLKNYGEDVPARFLKSLLASDLIGFQTIDDLKNFRDCLNAFVPDAKIDIQADDDIFIEFEGRKINAGAFPISIDVEGIEREANTPEVAQAAAALQAQFPDQTLALNAGRREPTKRLEIAVAGHQKALEQHSELRGKLTQLLVAPGSRETMAEYREYTEQIRAQVAAINKIDWGVTGWKPISYNEAGIRGTERAAHWKASEIGLYPTIDGMNVSVLEQLIARDKKRKFLPIIGKKTGARFRLPSALIVDGDDPQSVADALYAAYIMPDDEAMARANDMEQMLRRDTVFDWVKKYMDRLARIRDLRAQ